MAGISELGDSNLMKNRRLKSIRVIELSDHATRLNRRETTQLDLRLRQLRREENMIQRVYEREMYLKRLQLKQINETLKQISKEVDQNSREQTPISFYSTKTSRNQSAAPNIKTMEPVNHIPSRPNTTATNFQYTERAMTIFNDMTLKPTCQTLGNLLILLDDQKQDWPIRSKTMINLKNIY